MKIHYLLLILLFCYPIVGNSQEVLTAEKCRELSLQHNRQLKSSKYLVESRAEATRAASKDQYLQLNANTNFLYNAQKVTNEGASVSDQYLYRAGVSADQVIYAGGKIKRTIELNEIAEKQASQQVNLSSIDVSYRSDMYYWTAVASNETVLYWQRYLNYLNEFIEVVDERVNSGLVGRNDLLTAKVRYNEGELALEQSRANLKRAISQICTSIGKPVNTQLLVADSLLFNGLLPDTSNVFNTALIDRPEVKYSNYQLDAIDVQRQLIKSQYNVNLNAKLNLNYGNNLGSDDHGTNFIGLATLNIPISRWGKKKSELASNHFQANMEYENNEYIKEVISLEIQTAIISLEEAIKKTIIADQSRNNAYENLQIADNKYKEGISSIIEVTDAQTFLQNAVINYINSKANYFYSLSAYNRAVANY